MTKTLTNLQFETRNRKMSSFQATGNDMIGNRSSRMRGGGPRRSTTTEMTNNINQHDEMSNVDALNEGLCELGGGKKNLVRMVATHSYMCSKIIILFQRICRECQPSSICSC